MRWQVLAAFTAVMLIGVVVTSSESRETKGKGSAGADAGKQGKGGKGEPSKGEPFKGAPAKEPKKEPGKEEPSKGDKGKANEKNAAPEQPAKGSKSAPPGTVEQKQNLAKLKSDLEAIHGKSQVTPQMKQAVAQDLQRILSGASKPSEGSVKAFANHLTEAVADGAITTAEAIKLTQEMTAILNSANISQQDVQKLKADVQTLLKATNLTRQDMQTISNDVLAIVETAQQNAQNAKGKTKALAG